MRTLDRAKPIHKKPWASLIAIAALVASVSASAGELDGKGIICHSEKSVTGEPEWYWFAQGRVTQSNLGTNGTKAEVLALDLGEYGTEPTMVRWRSDSMQHKLDRRTLIHRASSYGEEYWVSQCEVAESWEVMRESIQTFKLRRQQAIDEQTRGNKI